MWSEMSYNQYNYTFSERLELEPDEDENVFPYYFSDCSDKLVAIEYIEKTKGGLY